MSKNHQRVSLSKPFKKILFALAILALCEANPAFGTDYTAIDLQQPGGVILSANGSGVSGTQSVGYAEFATGKNHALIWNSNAPGYVDLHPTSGYSASVATATNGTQQVGHGTSTIPGNSEHALLWTGSASSRIDLHPNGFNSSQAYGVYGTYQVGVASTSYAVSGHAILWNGTASNYVDLTPSGIGVMDCQARAICGTQQVGWGEWATTLVTHAFLWNGSAESWIDLNPNGFDKSWAYGTNGTQQVGYGNGSATGGHTHALLWNGSFSDYVDLNPNGFSTTEALGISGSQEVGYGSGSLTGSKEHALLWNGSADSYVDLHTFLPSGFTISRAQGIDSYGNIIGYATDTYGNDHTILWQSVPEPTTLFLFCFGGLAMLRKRRA